MRKVVYTEEQIKTVMAMLDVLTIIGTKSARNMVAIMQTLDSGSIVEAKEGEESNGIPK